MITFDVLTLKAFIQENSGFLTGARINKIQQPTRKEIILVVQVLDDNGNVLAKSSNILEAQIDYVKKEEEQ